MDSKEIERKKLPWFYRLILRFPKPVLEHFSPAWVHGIYWTIVIPLFVLFEFCLSFYLIVTLPFPTNLIAMLIVPTLVFIVFVRIQLERFMNAWNAMVKKEPTEWNIEKTLQGYMNLLQKQNSINKKKSSESN